MYYKKIKISDKFESIYRYYSNLLPPLLVRKKTSDIAVFQQIFIEKDYELPFDIDPRFIIDCGANVGYASLWFSYRFPFAKIIAVEPEDSNFKILKKNTQPHPNISILKAGIWGSNTYLKIKKSKLPISGNWDFQVKSSFLNTGLRSVTIDSLIKGYDKVDILKLDIEGSEKNVFESDCSWLKKVRVLIIEIHDSRYNQGCSEAFYKAIKGYDFKRFIKGENVILFKD